ncbi:CAP domain-containing protein [Microbacterium sp. GXF7504]
MRTMTKRTALTTATALALSLSAFGGTAAMAATPTVTGAPVASHAVSAAAPADLGAARQVILDETNAAHQANILQAETTHIGIGYALGADGRTYFTQDFAAYPAAVRPGTEQPAAEQPAPEQPTPEQPAFDRDRLLQEIRDRIASSRHPFAMEIAAAI